MKNTMTEQKTNELYDKALQKWGKEAQLLKLVEELNELAVATMHLINDPETISLHKGFVAEEIADVQIMCEQATRILGIQKDVSDVRNCKLYRLETRVGDGKTEQK